LTSTCANCPRKTADSGRPPPRRCGRARWSAWPARPRGIGSRRLRRGDGRARRRSRPRLGRCSRCLRPTPICAPRLLTWTSQARARNPPTAWKLQSSRASAKRVPATASASVPPPPDRVEGSGQGAAALGQWPVVPPRSEPTATSQRPPAPAHTRSAATPGGNVERPAR
jgi:hypothetical protein